MCVRTSLQTWLEIGPCVCINAYIHTYVHIYVYICTSIFFGLTLQFVLFEPLCSNHCSTQNFLFACIHSYIPYISTGIQPTCYILILSVFAHGVHFRIQAHKISDFFTISFLLLCCNIKLFNNFLTLFIFIIAVAVVFRCCCCCCTLHAVRCAQSPTGSPFLRTFALVAPSSLVTHRLLQFSKSRCEAADG